jgi:lipoyl(octanoyl) transferase
MPAEPAAVDPACSLAAPALGRRRRPDQAVEWLDDSGVSDYAMAVAAMERRVALIAAGGTPELVWLTRHAPLYTAGTSAKDGDLVTPDRFPVHRTGRGGQFTYHGPGQRIAYLMLDLTARGGDVRAFVAGLEQWLIATLAEFGVRAFCRAGRVGVWVPRPDKGAGREDKIAAIGIRVRRGVTFHGISLNVAPDLSHYDGIVPCGIREHGVTSLADLGVAADMSAVDAALRHHFTRLFGPVGDPGDAAGLFTP